MSLPADFVSRGDDFQESAGRKNSGGTSPERVALWESYWKTMELCVSLLNGERMNHRRFRKLFLPKEAGR